MSTTSDLAVAREDATLVIALNRPSALNALDAATLDDVRRAFEAAGADPGVRVVILTGAGDKAFAAGADIKELANASPGWAHDHARRGQAAFDAVERLGKPVIAAVNGVALGGGCELALACTLRIAADNARFGQPEINLGLLPGFGGSQRLARLVGRGRALELLLTGEPMGAEEALRIGLVNRVVPSGELMTAARQLATMLASKPPLAVRFILDAVNDGLEMPLDAALRYEAAMFGLAFATEDAREGTRAFIEKRRASFRGR
jgi:enoyl-CoA hydratase